MELLNRIKELDESLKNNRQASQDDQSNYIDESDLSELDDRIMEFRKEYESNEAQSQKDLAELHLCLGW